MTDVRRRWRGTRHAGGIDVPTERALDRKLTCMRDSIRTVPYTCVLVLVRYQPISTIC
jgi:hypothetical protein